MKNYELIFHSGDSIEITEEQEENINKLMARSSCKGLKINGDYVAFSSIARIKLLPSQQTEYLKLPSMKSTMLGMPDYKRQRALQNIIKGFRRHFAGRTIPPKSQGMLNNFIKTVSV